MADRLSGAIVAAGRGERLRPVSGTIPKPLVELAGKPLLIRQIDLLIDNGVHPIHVIVNSETGSLMYEHGVRLPRIVELLTCDTANSMESLMRLGEQITSEFFVMMTVDAILYARDVRHFVTHATKIIGNPAAWLDGAIGVVKWRGDANPLFANIADDGLITAFEDRRSPMVTAGIYLFSTAIFAHAAEARSRGLSAMRHFLAMLVEKGRRFVALEVPRAIDLDDAADLRAAREMLARESG